MKEVLIVENDVALNKKLTRILAAEGYKIVSSFTIRETQPYFKADAIHLVILNIDLPDGSGYEMFLDSSISIREAIEKIDTVYSGTKELAGRGGGYAFNELFARQILWNQQSESQLENAITNHEFKIYLQAQYNLQDETVTSAEALVRWEKNGNLIYPKDFISVLEQKDLIIKLDFYVFEQVCSTLRNWINEGISPIEIAVNFSRRHLDKPDFIRKLCKLADHYEIPHRFLVVEWTETAIAENEEAIDAYG